MSVAEYFNDLAKEHGRTPQAVDAPNQEALDCRWRVLGELIENGASVLDVGCGYGGFGDWLKTHKPKCLYSGIEIAHELYRLARENHRVMFGDVRNLKGHSDYVVAQGIFYKQDGYDACDAILAKMWELAGRGVAVTTICRTGEGELSFDAATLLRMVRDVGCTEWTLRHDYHPNDMCLYLWKT